MAAAAVVVSASGGARCKAIAAALAPSGCCPSGRLQAKGRPASRSRALSERLVGVQPDAVRMPQARSRTSQKARRRQQETLAPATAVHPHWRAAACVHPFAASLVLCCYLHIHQSSLSAPPRAAAAPPKWKRLLARAPREQRHGSVRPRFAAIFSHSLQSSTAPAGQRPPSLPPPPAAALRRHLAGHTRPQLTASSLQTHADVGKSPFDTDDKFEEPSVVVAGGRAASLTLRASQGGLSGRLSALQQDLSQRLSHLSDGPMGREAAAKAFADDEDTVTESGKAAWWELAGEALGWRRLQRRRRRRLPVAPTHLPCNC